VLVHRFTQYFLQQSDVLESEGGVCESVVKVHRTAQDGSPKVSPAAVVLL